MESLLKDIYEKGRFDLEYYRLQYPTFFFRDLAHIEKHIQRARNARPTVAFRLAQPLDGPSGVIGNWWNKFIRTEYNEKKQNIWIWGPPNVGKSTKVLLPMLSMARGYEIFDDPVFWHPFVGPYDFAFCDEFKGLKPIEELNKFMTPIDMYMSTKGSVTFKSQQLPVMILSNHMPEELYYKDRETLDALHSRFEVVHLTEIKDVF